MAATHSPFSVLHYPTPLTFVLIVVTSPLMYHVPERTRHVIVNPWPEAIRRILIGLSVLFFLAFARSFIEWLINHSVGDSKLDYNKISLAYFAGFIALIVGLIWYRRRDASIDSGAGQLRLFALNAFLATIAMYFIWQQQHFSEMFTEGTAEAYRGSLLVVITWLYIVVILQMIGTVIIALKDASGNVYDTDTEPL